MPNQKLKFPKVNLIRKNMKEIEYIIDKTEFLRYLKAKFTLIHDSNIFFRDLHYGVMNYVKEKLKKKLKYLEAEQLTYTIALEFEKQGVFKKMDNRTWLLNYPEFALPRPAAKPASSPAKPAEQSVASQPTSATK